MDLTAPRLEPAVRTADGSAFQVLPAGADRHVWLRERRDSIGGGEAAAVVGLSKYCSPYELWMTKTGRHPGPKMTAQMKAGIRLEPVTVDMFACETGLICAEAGMWRRYAAGWEHANPDRFTSDGFGLECKATFGHGAKEWADGQPTPHAIIQSQWYMHVTGRDRWYIALLIDGWQLQWWWLERDDKLIDLLVDRVAGFWHEHVLTDVPPPVDGSVHTREVLHAVYGHAYQPGTTVEIPGLAALVAERRALKESIKHLEADLEEVENTIKAGLGDHEIGTEHRTAYISWKSGPNTSTRYLREITA